MPKYALPHRFNSRLVLLDELPSGASGCVYKAQYQRDTQPIDVVVKFFDHAPSHEMFGYFTNEQVVLRELNRTFDHPNLVQYVTHDLTQEPFYLMTRFVPDAKSLSKLKAGDVPPALLARIATQVADALDYLHEGKHGFKPVIHRDVKPDNLLLDTDYNAVLIDLSIARHPHFNITDEKVMGTPTYMPPEQYEGAEVPASDQFSLAAVIYELLTGQPLLPKQPLKAYQQIKELRDTDYAKVTQTLGSGYSHTSRVLIQALSYDPEHRFVTCTAFANTLRAALEKDGKPINQPITLRKPNPAFELKRWVMPAAAVLAVLLLAGALWTGSQLLRGSQAADPTPLRLQPTATLVGAIPEPDNRFDAGKLGGAPVLNPTTGLMETPIPAPTRLVAPDPFGGQASGNATIIVAAVDTGRVNEPIRREPSYDAEIIGALPLGSQAIFLGGAVPQGNFVWYQIQYNGTVGWCRSLFCTLQ